MPNTRTALLAVLLSSSLASGALAQSQQQVVLFKTAAEDESLAELAAALDPVLASELAESTAVQVAARAAVDLPSMQLAIDCVGETVDCLRAAASQSGADSIVAPSVRHAEDGVLVTVLHFDPTQAQPISTIERRYTGERQGEQALTGVEGVVHELFGDPAARVATAAPRPPEQQPPAAAPAVAPAPEAKPGVPILPIVIGGVGVALLGTGVAFGLMSKASMEDYRNTEPSKTPGDHTDYDDYDEVIDDALAKHSTASTHATIANLMYGLGAGALVGAGVLLFWQLEENPADSEVRLQPSFGPGEAGLTLRTAWNDSL